MLKVWNLLLIWTTQFRLITSFQAMRKLAAAEADRGNLGTQAVINQYITLQEDCTTPCYEV